MHSTPSTQDLARELATLRAQVRDLERERSEWHDLQSVAKHVPAVFWIYDRAAGGVSFVSQAFERIWGSPCERLYEDPNFWMRAIHPDDRKRVGPEWERAKRIGHYGLEYRIVRPDQRVVWIRDRIIPFASHRGGDLLAGIAEDCTGQRRAEEALKSISKSVSSCTGEEFFHAFARHLSEALECEYVLIGERCRERPSRIKSVTFCAEGKIVDNFEYGVAGTPGERVFDAVPCVYPEGVQGLFPADHFLVENGIQSYLGVPLVDSRGDVLGILSALWHSSIPDLDLAHTLMEVFAHRAAAELGRLHAEEGLRQTNEGLEVRVASRTADLHDMNRLLRKSEERYRVFVDKTSDGFWCVEGDEGVSQELPIGEQVRRVAHGFRFVECNDVAAQRFGFESAAELLGTQLSDIESFWQAANQEELLLSLRSGQERAEFETRALSAQGTERFFRNNIVNIFDKNLLVRIWGTQRDVTAEKSGERDRLEFKEQNEAIIQTALDGIAIVDREGRLLAVNDASCEMTGYERDELLELAVWDLMPISREDALSEIQKTRLSISKSRQDQAVLLRKDGRELRVEINMRYESVRGGRIYCFLRDVTARLQAELLRRQHVDELAHVSRLSTAGEMATGIAHELNQPLSAIVNYTQGSIRHIRNGNANEEEILHAMERAASQARLAGEIIKRMRNFVRNEHMRHECSLNGIVREATSLIAHGARELRAEVKVELTDEPTTVLADPIQIEQVILNLTRNGLEAMAEAACEERMLSITTRALREENAVRVRIEDSGPGVPKEVRAKLFQPFFTTKPSGMGMGLSISHSIVEAHGGKLSCQPVCPGTAFEFTLPNKLEDPSE